MDALFSIGLQALAVLLIAPLGAARPARKQGRSDQALCDAASSGNAALVRSLLSQGVSVNSADEDRMTALMAAAFAGEAEVVRLLLASGADPNLQDEAGLTALMNAVIADGEMDLDGAHPVFLEVIELLMDADADLSLEDENGSTAGDYAASYELLDVSELLAAG